MADPVATDIDVVQGATFSMSVTWADKSTDPATPIPLTGYRAHMQVRSRQGATGTPLLNLASIGSAPSLLVEPNGSTGVVKVRISALNTAKLRRSCYYDLFVVKEDDATQAVRLAFGQITLFKSATIDDLLDDTTGEPEDQDSGSSSGSSGIASATVNSDGHLIFTYADSTMQDVGQVEGADGRGISSATINSSGNLVLTYTDATTQDVGHVVGASGSGDGGDATLPDPVLPVPAAPTVEDYGIGRRVVQWSGLDINGAPMPAGFERVDVYGRPGSGTGFTGNADSIPDGTGPVDFSAHPSLTPVGDSAFEGTYDEDTGLHHLVPTAFTTDLSAASMVMNLLGGPGYAAVRSPDLPVPVQGVSGSNAIRWTAQVDSQVAAQSALVFLFGLSPDDDRCVSLVVVSVQGAWVQALFVSPDGVVQNFDLIGGGYTIEIFYHDQGILLSTSSVGASYDMPDLGDGHTGSAAALIDGVDSGIVYLALNALASITQGPDIYLGSLPGGGTIIPESFYWQQAYVRPVTLAGTEGPDSAKTPSPTAGIANPVTQDQITSLQQQIDANTHDVSLKQNSILQDPDGHLWTISVDSNGQLSAVAYRGVG